MVLTDVKSDIDSSWDYYKYDVYYAWVRDKHNVMLGIAYVLFFIRTFFDVVSFKLKITYCKKYGHKYEVGGYANPESAVEEFTCKRCGHYIKNVLY